MSVDRESIFPKLTQFDPRLPPELTPYFSSKCPALIQQLAQGPLGHSPYLSKCSFKGTGHSFAAP